MPAHGNSGLSNCTEEQWHRVVSVLLTLLLLVILLSTVASVSMWRPSTSFLLRPAPICSASVIFLLGRCFLLGAFSCPSLGQSLFSSRFSRFFWIAGHNCRIWYRYQPRQCPISRVPCYRANHSPMNGLCCRCQRHGHMRPARVPFLLRLTLPDVQLLFSWGLT